MVIWMTGRILGNMLPSTLDKTNPVPLYYQLKTILLESIRSAALQPNDRLPTESAIAQQYNVSKATVRQALGELANEGVLQRIQGRGTFVAPPRVDLGPILLYSFTVQMGGRGIRPSSRVLEQRVTGAQPEIAGKLRIAENSPVLYLVRIRLADGEPMGIQRAYVPLDLAPGLENNDFAEHSLYKVLQDNYGLQPARAHETHYAVIIEPDQAETLETTAGAAGLACERLTLLPSGRPMELVYSVMRGDRHQVVLELSATDPPVAKFPEP